MDFPDFPAASSSDPLPDPLAINHPTLAAVVADKLRQLITDGTLKPGTGLNERDLCERLKVSRTPLREAYRILSADGLVSIQPKRGAVVIEHTPADIENIFDVIAVLEGLAIRQAAQRATDQELQEIASLHARMLEGFRKQDIKAYFVASMGTHVAISRAAHNPALAAAYERLNLQVQALRYKSNLDPDEWSAGVADHERFVKALLERDAEAAEQHIRAHLVNKKSYHLQASAATA
ncbi:GntR family transcriptional regulator [Pollutimonas bauzanensis]|uniref:DNA-binding transcriptional regulator, GntR family n=1 Tax=Pollutimonas bauzanensis TaxID=658167 RepID=A0A1M5Z339_9BURK|nr:GntR family transcriptional regulator [Pollutimonas bauzanensis]SHI18666.1 DNA-binding transcriptional regulator, GntR family [Pollutimonas bauzanensis]